MSHGYDSGGVLLGDRDITGDLKLESRCSNARPRTDGASIRAAWRYETGEVGLSNLNDGAKV